jgi:hypothetical protein
VSRVAQLCAGKRHFPEELPQDCVSVVERHESFEMRSTEDMYKEFPGLVRSSYPLYIRTAGPQACLRHMSSPSLAHSEHTMM